MNQVADKVHEEYWRPAVPISAQPMPMDARSRSEVCEACGSEFVVGARFCHACGGDRAAVHHPHAWAEALDFNHIKQVLGFSTGSLVAFIVGLVCVLAAVSVGLIYSATTLVDWQAVQTWRIEWMLAATMAFVAGILLKKSDA